MNKRDGIMIKETSDFTFRKIGCFAVRTGLEPATPGVTGLYSNQLNYRTSQP